MNYIIFYVEIFLDFHLAKMMTCTARGLSKSFSAHKTSIKSFPTRTTLLFRHPPSSIAYFCSKTTISAPLSSTSTNEIPKSLITPPKSNLSYTAPKNKKKNSEKINLLGKLRQCSFEGNYQYAESLFTNLDAKYFRVNDQLLNAFLDTCSKYGNIKKAEEFLQKFTKYQIKKNGNYI